MRLNGFTLVELMVVMVVVALIAGLSTLAIGSLRVAPQSASSVELHRGRDSALRWGRPVSIEHGGESWLFLPDGRAFGSGLDPWTGASLKGGRDAPSAPR